MFRIIGLNRVWVSVFEEKFRRYRLERKKMTCTAWGECRRQRRVVLKTVKVVNIIIIYITSCTMCLYI